MGMFTKATETVVENVAEWFVKLLLDSLKNVFYPLPSKAMVAASAAKYLTKLAKEHGTIQVLNAPEPVKVTDIFVSAKLASRKHFLRNDDAHQLQGAFVASETRDFLHDTLRFDAIQLANKHQNLIVLGEPGVGKSTFLKRVALEAIKPGAAIFTQHDVLDPMALKSKILSKADPLSELLCNTLSVERQLLLTNTKGDDSPEGIKLRQMIAAIINEFISEPQPFYKSIAVDTSILRTETRLLLKQEPAGGSDLMRLNRLLFEDNYRLELTGALTPTKCFSLEHRLIPVFIELKGYRDLRSEKESSGVHSHSYIKNHILTEFHESGFSDFSGTVESLLSEGKMLILLDALDEIPDKHFPAAIEDVNEFVKIYGNNRYIVSARAAFYHQSYLRNFSEASMVSFDNDQIDGFAHNWFNKTDKNERKDRAQLFLDQLFDRRNAATLELARTPLLLMFLCLSYDVSDAFPSGRAILYDRVLNILMERWERDKNIARHKTSDTIPMELELKMLKEIAARSFDRNKIFFGFDDLDTEIAAFLKDETRAPNNLSADVLRREITEKQGLFVERTRLVFTFSHLTLQEYLAACHFIEQGEVESIISRRFFESRWREVILLIMGKSSMAEDFRSMRNILLKYARTHAGSLALFQWISEASDLNDDYKTAAAKRAVGAYISLWLIGDPDTDRLAKLCLEIAGLIDPNIPDQNLIQQFEAFYSTGSSDIYAGSDYANNLFFHLERTAVLNPSTLNRFKSCLEAETQRIVATRSVQHTGFRKIVANALGTFAPEHYFNKEVSGREFSAQWIDVGKYVYGLKLLLESCVSATQVKSSTERAVYDLIFTWPTKYNHLQDVTE